MRWGQEAAVGGHDWKASWTSCTLQGGRSRAGDGGYIFCQLCFHGCASRANCDGLSRVFPVNMVPRPDGPGALGAWHRLVLTLAASEA